MRARAFALALAFAPVSVHARSLWSRVRHRDPGAARQHRDAAGVHALFADLGGSQIGRAHV